MLKIKKAADFWAGALFLSIGIAAVYLSQGYTIGTARQMGPGYFPAAIGCILSLLGAVQVLASLRGSVRLMSGVSLRPVFFVLLAAASFGFLLRPAGLVAAVISVVVIASLGSAQSRPAHTLAVAVVLAAGSAIVFVHYLGQPLPLVGSWLSGN
ncbi:tripartite tricarboxylate transporter TctB family protein [Mesorhizobium sp. CAU 1741]|uniref:tripartite tricarboxylate transporter TctB family protein n=1 Tax=Mesorhizobium sp. CAU 1741 TaxID=3140366 RepID=UPI00325B706B